MGQYHRKQEQGGRQDVYLWLIVLERMASTLQDDYNIGAPVTIRPTLELFTAFRERIEEVPPVHPRYGPHVLPSFPGGPFAASRQLARELAREQHLRLPDKYQMNHELTKGGHFPVLCPEMAEDLVKSLVEHLVTLARYLARELPHHSKRVSEDYRLRKPVSSKVQALMSRLFWEGLVEGIRPHIEYLQEELDTLDLFRANPVRRWYTSRQVIDVQLRIAEYRAAVEPSSELAEFLDDEATKPYHIMN